jgi:hypothetical protein
VHADASLSPFATALGYVVRFGVPLVCAAIVIDAGRRSAASTSRRTRITWIALPLALIVGLIAGLIAPGVAALQLLAVASLPLVVVLGFVYLLTVVFPRSAEPAEASAGRGGS